MKPAQITLQNKLARFAWSVVWLLLFRPSPVVLHSWRRLLLRAFGAKVGAGAVVYPSARVWAPWNLEMAQGSCLADHVDCYNVGKVTLGQRANVSQYGYLCAASRDIRRFPMELVIGDINIEDDAWVAARAYVGPDVTIREGAVIGACSVVTKDVEPWTVVAGNPARQIGERNRVPRAELN